MPIDAGQKTVDLIKQLSEIRFERDLEANELLIQYTFQMGYVDAEGSFVSLSSRGNSLTPEQATYVLSLRPSDGGLADPPLSQILLAIFEGIETGAVALPEPPDEPGPEPSEGVEP